MTKQTISLGAAANDGTGDTLRQAGQKINDNFDELYARLNPLVHNAQTISVSGATVDPEASAIFMNNSSNINLADGTHIGEVKYFINIGSSTSSVVVQTYGPTGSSTSSTFTATGQVQAFIWHSTGWYLMSSKTLS